MRLPAPDVQYRRLPGKQLTELAERLFRQSGTKSRLVMLLDWLLDVQYPAREERLWAAFLYRLPKVGQARRAIQVFAWLQSQPPGPQDMPTFHFAMLSALSTGDLSTVQAIWDSAKHVSLPPRYEQMTCDYMSALLKRRHFHQTVQLFGELRLRYNNVHEQAWALALRAHTALYNEEDAFEVWDDIERVFGQPSRAFSTN